MTEHSSEHPTQNGTERWLWLTPEIRPELSTGALVYSFGLAHAIAQSEGVSMHIVGIGTAAPDAPAGADVTYEPVAAELRGGVRSVASTLPNLAYATHVDSFVGRVRERLTQPWDVVVVDGLQMAWASDVVRAAFQGPVVFVAHNHEASLRRGVACEGGWRNPKTPVLWLDAVKAARAERRCVRTADLVTTITSEDHERFRCEHPEADFVEILPGWKPPTADADSTGTVDHRPALLDRPRRIGMLGSYDWHVKQENLRRFLAAADGLLADADIELVIGGAGPDEFRRELEPGLRATRFVGWVDDPAAFLATCRMAVIAEPLGGGFKLKSLDYVFNGVPIACLAGNAVGLGLTPGESVLEAPDLEALGRLVVRHIDDESLESVARRAETGSAREFSWAVRAAYLRDALGLRTP
ncbi:MAG: glycosyltransferase [Actinomycetota bacterium]